MSKSFGQTSGLSVSPNPVWIYQSSNTYGIVSIQANGDWFITQKPSWINLTNTSGTGGNSNFYFNTNDVLTSSSRSDIMTFENRDGSVIEKVVLNQYRSNYSNNDLYLYTSSIFFGASSNLTQNFSFYSSGNWTISEYPSWITVSQSSGTSGGNYISLQAQVNQGSRKSDYLTVKNTYTGDKLGIPVKQAGNVAFNVSPNAIVAKSSSGTCESVWVDASNSWYISNQPSFLYAYPSSGIGSQLVSVCFNSNFDLTKTGSLTFFESSSNTAKNVLVTLPGANTLLFDSYNVKFGATTYLNNTISISSYNNWRVSNKPTWVSVNPTSATGSRLVTLTSGRNSGSERYGQVEFTDTDNQRKYYVSVNQYSSLTEFSVSPSNIVFDQSTYTTRNIQVNSSGKWSIFSYPNWLILNQLTDIGNSIVTVGLNYYQNSLKPQIGKIFIKDNESQSIGIVNVTSLGANGFSVSPLDIKFNKQGGQITVNVTAPNSYYYSYWSAYSYSSWISANASGYGSGSFTIYASQNTGKERSGSISLSLNNITYTLKVYQDGSPSVVSVSTTSINLPLNTSTAIFIPITYESGSSWQIKSVPNWVSTSGYYSVNSGINLYVSSTVEPRRGIIEIENINNGQISKICIAQGQSNNLQTTTVTSPISSIRYGDTVPTTYTILGLSNTANVYGSPETLVNGSSLQGAGSTISININTCEMLSDQVQFIGLNKQLTVLPALLTVKGLNLTRKKGESNPRTLYTILGFVNGESSQVLSGMMGVTTEATKNAPEGDYSVDIDASGISSPNYEIQVVPGNIRVAGVSAIEDQEEWLKEVKLMPNPSVQGQEILLQIPNDLIPISIQMVGPTGLVVLKNEGDNVRNNTAISTTDLPSGLYVIEVLFANGHKGQWKASIVK